MKVFSSALRYYYTDILNYLELILLRKGVVLASCSYYVRATGQTMQIYRSTVTRTFLSYNGFAGTHRNNFYQQNLSVTFLRIYNVMPIRYLSINYPLAKMNSRCGCIADCGQQHTHAYKASEEKFFHACLVLVCEKFHAPKQPCGKAQEVSTPLKDCIRIVSSSVTG